MRGCCPQQSHCSKTKRQNLVHVREGGQARESQETCLNLHYFLNLQGKRFEEENLVLSCADSGSPPANARIAFDAHESRYAFLPNSTLR